MALGKLSPLALGTFVLALAACSQSSGGGGNALLSVSQDLTLDPDGTTTVLSFQKALPAMLGPGNFEASGGQIALTVDVDGLEATVTWDERVTPSHAVTPVAIAGVSAAPHAVVTTDASAPTFAITGAEQVPGLGGDLLEVSFSGPYVVPDEVQDPASWRLTVGGEDLDLAGSALSFDEEAQVLEIELGPLANLHADFELAATGVHSVADVAVASAPVAGVATGDAVAPTFVSAVQNLAESEFGFVVDFTFSEAMDPVFATQLANFGAGFPVFASDVEQPAEDVLRVTFTNPIVPGLDAITLGGSLMDAHGNPVVDPGAPVAVAAGTTVANGYDGDPVLDTVSGQGGDVLAVAFEQALDPDTVLEWQRWDVQSPTGVSLDLSGATLTYDLLEKTLQIELAEDVVTGDTFTVQPAAGPDVPIDVDGEPFAAAFSGTVTGDVTPVGIETALQDRTLDPTGLTIDVTLSEEVQAAGAETPGNWAVTGGAAVTSATLLASGETVRLVLDGLALPGEDELSAAGLVDLAGNPLAAPLTGVAIASTDAQAPLPGDLAAVAVEGADNDEISVVFDDDMVASDVLDPLSWSLEMPPGTPLDTSNATVSYDAPTRTATLVLDGGDEVDLLVGEEARLVLADMRDVGGNPVAPAVLLAEVTGDSVFPAMESAWIDAGDPTRLHVQFSEPMRWLDDVAGATRYVVRDGSGLVAGYPAVVQPDADRQGATLRLGFAAAAGVHTVDVSGLTDLAGNALFAVEKFPAQPEDANEPALDAGLQAVVTVSGEENDVLNLTFDRPMSSFGITDPDHYTLSDGTPVDLDGATLAFDGDRTVTIRLDGQSAASLATGTAYTLTADGLRSRQGVWMTAASADVEQAQGDAIAPALQADRTRIDAQSPADSVLIELSEAVDPADAEDEASFSKGGVTPDSAVRLGHRTVRATWSGGVAVGEQIDVTVRDLAGNLGVSSQLVEPAVSAGPTLASVSGVIQPGFGGDRVVIAFHVPVDPQTAFTLAHYALDQGGVALDLTGAVLRMESASNAIVVLLPDGVELDPFQQVHAVVTGVKNQDGIVISPAGDLYGTVTGDAAPPDFDAAFVNLREDPSGHVIDVRFTEDVDPAVAGAPASYGASGGQTVVAAEMLAPDVVRLVLSAPLALGQSIETAGLEDAAGIASGAISIAPVQ